MEKRKIILKDGKIELDATERFYDAVRFEYGLDKNDIVTDELIEMFIYGTMNNAITKYEKEQSSENE